MKKSFNQSGLIHTLPLLIIVAAVGIISFLLISSTLPLNGLFGLINPKPRSHAATSDCGLAGEVFCDTFDLPMPGQSRTGGLDSNVWGVSRAMGGGYLENAWAPTNLVGCNGNTTVTPPNDIVICNGQLREATDDQHDVSVLAMYPKQPFDFAGRTGKVSFDVSNDTQGPHAAWPEFWITDTPVPAPFNHFSSWVSFPKNGFGIRMASNGEVGSPGECQNLNNINQRRWTVDSAVVIRNYAEEDTEGYGTPTGLSVTQTDCVLASSPGGPLNHVEFRISQNLIEVWASDPGSTTLKKIAIINNPNLSFTRGLVWMEDVHYNASKGPCPPWTTDNAVCQTQHTFAWDNVAFDGPFTYRDFSYDALDNNTVNTDGTIKLGKTSQANQTASWNVLNMPANPQASVVRVLFNFFSFINNAPFPTTLNVIVNGHAHSVPWPYPANDSAGFATWRTLPVQIPLTDLVTGTNVVQLGADQPIVTANVNIALVDVPGGVPVLPGSVNTYPGVTSAPTPTPNPASSPTPQPSVAATQPPGTTWNNVTGNLAGLASECGNLTSISAVPGSNSIIAGVAQKGLWSNASGTNWSQLGTGAGSANITNRPMWITYDPNNPAIFWEAGIYNGGGVYKTTNGGNTFTQLGSVTHVDSVSVDFSDPNRQTLIAGGHEQSQKVYKSTDGGQTWTNIGANLPAGSGFSTNVLLLNAQTYIVNADTSWGGGTPGIYRTTNGGASWTQVATQGPGGSVAPLLARDGTIYWTYGGGLLKSTNQGVSWSLVGSGLQNIHPIELTDGRLVAVGGNTLVISSNGGSTWSSIGNTLPYTPVSMVYSTSRKAFFISHFDCSNAVPSDAVMQMNYDFGFTAPPTPSPSPATCPKGSIGDIDCDGKVSILDYSTLVSNYGKTGIGTLGDIDNSGKVDIFDYSTLVSNYGK